MNTSTVKKLSTPIIVIGASARLTRFVTSDTLGKYWIHDPINQIIMNDLLRRKAKHEHPSNGTGPREPLPEPGYMKYVEGLSCPWCVGFWIGAGAVIAERATRNPSTPTTRALRGGLTILGQSLALNLVTAPIVAHLDQ